MFLWFHLVHWTWNNDFIGCNCQEIKLNSKLCTNLNHPLGDLINIVNKTLLHNMYIQCQPLVRIWHKCIIANPDQSKTKNWVYNIFDEQHLKTVLRGPSCESSGFVMRVKFIYAFRSITCNFIKSNFKYCYQITI